MSNITRLDRAGPAQSPFLPGTKVQYAWDSTSLGYLKTCPRLYQYIMIEGWSSGAEESVHLRFGIEYHKALEEYDIARAEGMNHPDAVRKMLRDLLVRTYGWDVDITSKAGKYKNRNTLVRTVLWYLDKFADDPAKTYILNDGTAAVELSFRYELEFSPAAKFQQPGKPQPYMLSGHLDRVVDFNGELFVMDRKTTTTTPGDYYFSQFQPNNQMTLYSLASKIILGAPIKGVIIDAAQIMLDYEKTNIPGARFVRGVTYRTDAQLAEWLQDLRYWFTLAEAYAAEGYWPMNDTACDKFGGCRFREICSKSPQVRERFLEVHFTKLPPEDRWNPLKPR